MRPTIVLLLALMPFSAQAQIIDTIEVNTRTSQAKTRIPFDAPFILKVPCAEKPVFVDYIAHRTARDFQTYYRKKRRAFVVPNLPPSHIGFEKQAGKGFAFLTFDRWPYKDDPTGRKNDVIGPSKNLVVMLPAVDERGHDLLMRWHLGDYVGARDLLTKIENDHLQELGAYYLLPEVDSLKRMHDLVVDNLDAIKAKEDRLAAVKKTAFDLRKSTSLDSLVALFLSGAPLTIPTCTTGCDVLKVLHALRTLDPGQYPDVLEGARTVTDPEKKTDQPEQVANLKNTESTLSALVILQRSAEVLLGQPMKDQQVLGLHALIEESLRIHEEIGEEKRKAFTTTFEKMHVQFIKVKQFDASTTFYSLKTRASFRAIPDFGIVVYGMQKGFTRPAPYLGVQLNFRQVDKSIPLGSYPKGAPWNHLSFGLGYTVVSVAEEGKREDFFEKGALMTGLGVRLSHALRINGGALWFYQKEANPVLSGRSIAYAPYLGLSVDLDVREIVNGFDKLVFKQP